MPVLLTLAMALVAGLLMALGFAPYNQPWAPLLGLAVLFSLTAMAPGKGRVAAYGYLFGLGYAGLGVYWIYISIADFGGGPLAAALATSTLIAAFALIPMVALLLGRFAGRQSSSIMVLAALPFAWVAIEWLRSWFLTGATWLSVGYSQIDTPLSVWAPVLGVYGPSLAIALMAGGLAWWFLKPLSLRFIWPVALAAVFLVTGVVLDRPWSQPSGAPLQVALIQGNVPQDQKWRPEQRADILSRYMQHTRAAFGHDLIIWPETAVPAIYHQVAEDWLEPLARDASQAGSALVVGAPIADPAGDGLFNGIVAVSDSPQFYYKRHLVPFGEYVPLRDFAGGLFDFIGAPLGDFNAGTSAAPLLVAGHQIGASICYEVTFGAELLDGLPDAEILLNVSNDAWFGESAAPWQHLQMARMRALETARPMLRATNTGVSAIIDQQGQIQAQTGLFEESVLQGQVVPHTGGTPYMRWSDWPIAIGSLLGLIIAGSGRRRGYRLFHDV